MTSSDNLSSRVRQTLVERLRGMAIRVATARWPAAAAGLVLLSVATWSVTTSAIFDLRTLHIRGNAHLTKTQVAKVGGLTRDLNVLWTLPGTIERRLESHPWIREAHVSRTLPSGLTVVIKERRAVAVLPESGAVVAPDGRVLGKKKASRPLPVISTTVAGGGEQRTLSQSGLAVARAMPVRLRRLVEDITVGDNGLIELRLRDGTTVRYGDRSQMMVKAAVLRAILRWSVRTGTTPETIDVSVPGAPIVIPATSTQSAA